MLRAPRGLQPRHHHDSWQHIRYAQQGRAILALDLNPPYDSEIGSLSNRRMEQLFLGHTFPRLRIGGVLVLVIPFERFITCVDVLSSHFTDVRPNLLADPSRSASGRSRLPFESA